MRTRLLLLIANFTLGLLMNDLSAAQSRAVTEVPDAGVPPEALERAYIESYEQSGFRLAGREKHSLPGGSWMSVLVFELKSSPEGPGAPGTTLALAGEHATVCDPCSVSRQSFRGPDADNPDPAVFKRGRRMLLEADMAALTKVRQRSGVSLPPVEKPTP
ncbi:hypothetical protein [Xanthomonas sp. NCPPB 2632]|uniref:hypothetical protein n=1 Tax=Xanthomonas sp. NCPPB 2632 TaxID=3240912 RepID=UPI0035149B7D